MGCTDLSIPCLPSTDNNESADAIYFPEKRKPCWQRESRSLQLHTRTWPRVFPKHTGAGNVRYFYKWTHCTHSCLNRGISSVQSLSRVRLFATPWIAARQASLSITNSRSSLRLSSIESVMPSSHLILCPPLLLLPPIPPSIRVFSSESALRMRGPTSCRQSENNASLERWQLQT